MPRQLVHPNHVTRQAAKFALLVQEGVHLRAIIAQLLRDIDAMSQAKNLAEDTINNHPVVLGNVSKIVSLTRFSAEREVAALDAIERLVNGDAEETEVISQ